MVQWLNPRFDFDSRRIRQMFDDTKRKKPEVPAQPQVPERPLDGDDDETPPADPPPPGVPVGPGKTTP